MEQDGVEIVGDITDIETITTGRGIRRLKHSTEDGTGAN
jgi:hypothetical protein